MYINRHLRQAFETANGFFPVLLLTGARQVGKTTFLRHLAEPGRRYVTLDDLELRLLAQDDPKGFLDRFSPPVLIDEIQHVPSLLSYIKQRVDECRFQTPEQAHGLYWLTGSQQFELMRGVSESLAGRIGVFELGGLAQSELDGRPNVPFTPCRPLSEGRRPGLQALFRRIWQGSYPEVIQASGELRSLFYASYVTTCLERDIRSLANVQDLDRFYRFLLSCAARTGQLVNASELARDAGIGVTTAQSWLTILEASHLIYLLRPYTSNLTSRLVKVPKLYFLDTGLCAHLTHWPTPETLEAGAMSGALFETWCVAEIVKTYWNAGRHPDNLYFYRDRDQREVDILLETAEGLHPIECKKTATPRPEDARHFQHLDKLGKPILKGAILCACDTPVPLPNQNVLCIPACDI